MHVVIKSPDVITTFNDKGQAFHKQMALLETGGDYPLPFKLRVEGENGGYSPGRYRFADGSFRTDRFGGLEVDPFSIKLVQVAK